MINWCWIGSKIKSLQIESSVDSLFDICRDYKEDNSTSKRPKKFVKDLKTSERKIMMCEIRVFWTRWLFIVSLGERQRTCDCVNRESNNYSSCIGGFVMNIRFLSEENWVKFYSAGLPLDPKEMFLFEKHVWVVWQCLWEIICSFPQKNSFREADYALLRNFKILLKSIELFKFFQVNK